MKLFSCKRIEALQNASIKTVIINVMSYKTALYQIRVQVVEKNCSIKGNAIKECSEAYLPCKPKLPTAGFPKHSENWMKRTPYSKQTRGRVLNKQWCCVGGDVKHKILDLSPTLLRKIGHRKEIGS